MKKMGSGTRGTTEQPPKEDTVDTMFPDTMFRGKREGYLDFRAKLRSSQKQRKTTSSRKQLTRKQTTIKQPATTKRKTQATSSSTSSPAKMAKTPPVTTSKTKATEKSRVPAEILQMDERAIELYKNALEEGQEHNYSIRLLVTGPYGVGKSTLTKRLLCQDVDINDMTSTDSIDVHVKKCKVSLETSRWKMDDTDDNTTQRLAKVLQSARANDTADESLSTEHDASEDYDGVHLQDTDKAAAEAYENITSDTGNIVDVDDAPKSSDYNRLKHKELLLKDLKDVISSPTDEDEDHADASVWDFGGPFVFYTTHQMFLSHRAIYILVIDMSQVIHAVVDDDEPYFDCSGSKSLEIEDFLDSWLNSIHDHSDREKPGTPKVILVGTHADKLNPDTRYKETEAIFDAIRNRFSDKDISLHFIEKDFGLSNAEIDPQLDDLRKTILDVAKQQSYWGEIRPAKWILLERLLEELRRKGVEIMSHSEVEDLKRNLPVPIADDQLELFLCFQHETANIMYFSVPGLQNYIVLSPKFLVNALKSLITAEMFCKKRVAILDKWIEFRQKGILRTSLIDAVWNREENQIFRENREHILSLMEHLNIIARPVLYSDDDEPEEHFQNKGYYLVPCMLKESPPISVFHAEGPFMSKTCLRLVLENVAFPSAIFNRLLVGCMSYWPLARCGKKYHIYCGCGQFDVDVQHRLTLAFHSNVVSLRITRYSQINRYPGVDICRRVYRTVKEILERIGKCLSLVLTYEILIQCPQCTDSVTSMKCWHSMEKLKSCDEFPCHEHDTVAIRQPRDLLKYWFELKDRDPIESNSSEDGDQDGSRKQEVKVDVHTHKKTASPSTTTPTTTLPLHLPPDAAHCEEGPSSLLHDEELDSDDGSDKSKSNCQSSSTFKTQWEKKGSSKTMPSDVYESVSFCSLIKASSPEIIGVWEGYRPEEKEHEKQELEHVFVVIVERKIDNLNEKIPCKVRIIQRLRNEVSEEAKRCLKKEAILDFSLEQHNKMRDTLLRYSGDLMRSHSNLEMVSASKIKSSKGGETTQTEPCILLYVHVKGIIPVNEKAFPKYVGDFRVDVREGVFTNYSDPQLAMGCTIQGEKDKCGKIAGFVHLDSGNIGCLTCSHIFKTSDIYIISDAMEVDPTSENVYQISPTGSRIRTPFGILQSQHCICKPGFTNKTGNEIGIDAALIEITERLRNPKDGNYKHSVCRSFACDDTLDFYSGEILTSREEVSKMYFTNKMKCKIVRKNKNRVYVRTGRIIADAASVRQTNWEITNDQGEYMLYAQFHIQPDATETVDGDDQSFAKEGDSGSLVFLMSENGQQIWAIGMVVGGPQDGSAIVTPIWAVLDAFGLSRKFISFQVTDLADQVKSLNRKFDEMDKKLDAILDGQKNRPGQNNS